MIRQNRKLAAAVLAIFIAGSAGMSHAATKWTDVSEGRLEIKNPEFQSPKKNAPSVAPLTHTDVNIKVRGFVAEVTVTQRFVNPLEVPIDAEYVFPLPDGAAVNATEMRIGKRVIRGKIDRRAAARETYTKAKKAGKRASLLEQERPNIFTQSVANIAPGETIEVVIRYVETLEYKDGLYEIVYPMVVGPRYIPGNAQLKSAQSGRGRISDTDQVPDASRITPPVLKPGQRAGFDVAITVDLDMGVPISKVTCPTHEITTPDPQGNAAAKQESTATLSLTKKSIIPNKDFVLRIATAGEQPEIGFMAHHDGKDGYFTLVLQPPAAPSQTHIRPREMLIVMDCSGSMNGKPINMEKKAVTKLLDELRPSDSFNVLAFNRQATKFKAAPVPATAQNITAAKRWVSNRRAQGGTEMLTGIRAALQDPPTEERLRIVAIFTDGFIGNDWAVIGETQKLLRGARLFSFGVGAGVNRFLIDRMALSGRGVARYILPGDKPEKVIDEFCKRIATPILTDIQVTVDGVAVRDLTPQFIPDMFAGSPIYLHGRYDQPGEGTIEVVGRIGIKPSGTKSHVDFPAPSGDSSPLGSIWARDRIKRLELDKHVSSQPDEITEQITQLALEHSLMTAYTSFVAVDEVPTGLSDESKLAQVVAEVPEGVSHQATTGQRSASHNTTSNPPLPSSGPGRRRGAPSFGGGPVGPIVFAMLIGMIARKRKMAGKSK